jgi:phage tail-like protein
MGPIGNRREAFAAYTFVVEIDGERSAYFRSASGLKSEAEAVSVQEGGVNEVEHKLVGRTKYPNLVLKQGFADGKLWRKRLGFTTSDTSPIQRFNGKEVHKWQFQKAWICKWEGPEFDSGKSEISLETIEIAHEGLSLVGAGGASPQPPRSIKSALQKSTRSRRQ